MVFQDVISNKQWNVGVDFVKIVCFFLMKLEEEIRINILFGQLFMYVSSLYF